jgi:hypothetical protein
MTLQAGGVPATPLPKTTSDAEEYYIREIQKRGMSRPVAEGIGAGMGSESGLDPSINERDPVVPGSRGGFGLYQLTGPRRIAFERYAAENGKDVNNPDAQLDFMMSEFAGPERAAYDALIQSPDAQSAATVFTDQFLRPGVSHSAQSANEAARMSGQPYDPAMAGAGMNIGTSTMSAPEAAAGGALPQTVESILSSLYPTAAEDEKAARRKDIWRGLSQGLSALSQGGQVDLSNIAANADTRRRQNVLDMRDRERARAGASLIYSQTGDSDMAGAVAAGTMSINDVFSKRERDRIEQQADAQRLKTEQANGSLADLIGRQDAADLGLSEDAQASAVEAIRGGADIPTVLSVTNIAKVAEASRKAEDEKAAAAEQRVAAIERMREHPDQVLRTASSLMELDPNMSLADAIKSATPAAGGDKGYEFQAKITARMNAFGEDEATATRAVLEQEQKAAGVTIAPDGTITVNSVPAAGGAPAVSGGAPAAGGAPAGTVGSAFGTMFGSVNDAAKAALLPGDLAQQAATLAATEAGTAATGQATAQAAEAAPTELALKKTELATNRQQLEQTIAQETDVNKKISAEAALADLKVQEAQLTIDELRASAPTDAEKAKVDLATAQANLESATLENEKKHRELADAETGKAASLAKSLARADTGASVTTSTVSDILKATADWEAGMLGGIQRAGAALIPGSDTYNVESVLIPQLDANSIISNITAMKAASPSGATGFGATTAPELDALRDLLGKLDIKGDPALLRQNARVLNNYVLDSAYGTVEQIKANDKLTDAEKEFYGQRYDVKSGEIKYLGVTPIDEGVITMWDNPAEPLDPNALTPAEKALYDSTLTGGNN